MVAELKHVASVAYSGLRLGAGAARFGLSGRTPRAAHQAMINLFCASSGRFNDWLSRAVATLHPPIPLPRVDGVLGRMEKATLEDALTTLRRDGYLVFPEALPAGSLDALLALTRDRVATVRPMDGEREDARSAVRYNGGAPVAVRYDYPVQTLLDCEAVQALLADCSLLTLAQAYLGACPRADVLSMWWHTAFKDEPDSEAAQFFHFDLDRLKWLKVFIYLTDVGPDNGPHTFVAGSHRTGSIPARFLRRGYARLPDDEVRDAFGASACVELTAPRGTIIVEDTRGLHKGKVVRAAPRLVLQLQLSNSLFGATYGKHHLRTIHDPGLRELLSHRPAIYEAFL
jgi:hypothetical protein